MLSADNIEIIALPDTNTDINTGLTQDEAERRFDLGFSNINSAPKTKSVKSILFENVFTLFNLLNLVMAALLFFAGEYEDMLFLFIVLANLLIGIVQGIRAKRATDKLSIMAATTVCVIRDSEKTRIKSDEIVIGDVIAFSTGDYIVADCTIRLGECEVDESFITGENEPVCLGVGGVLRSGTFVTAGSCRAVAEKVGKDSFISSVTEGAKKFKSANSVIVTGLKKIIKVITLIIIPLSVLFFTLDITGGTSFNKAVTSTVAAMLGMIPQGLVLLVAAVLALSVLRFARKNVLVKELYSVENLARVDTICLDKTGTITNGNMVFEECFAFEGNDSEELYDALSMLSNAQDRNATMKPIYEKYGSRLFCAPTGVIPFSSRRKKSAVFFGDKGAYIIGAPEYVLDSSFERELAVCREKAKEYRVVCVAKSSDDFKSDCFPENVRPLGYVCLSDGIRKDAADTVRFFEEQGVTVKVISGDNHLTVSSIASKVGIKNFDKTIDMSALQTDCDYRAIASEYTIFGRSSPQQKQALIKAMRENGHTVAMTGDGVNDVLAMKEADCSVAINEGTDAARNIADIVLLDSSYSAVPDIVKEGRSAINNLQLSSSLFLVKTTYSMILTIAFLLLPFAYPFKPIQLTLISSCTTALPAIILALKKNGNRIHGNFLKNALLNALPVGISVAVGIIATCCIGDYFAFPEVQLQTICVIISALTAFMGLWFIIRERGVFAILLTSLLALLFAVSLYTLTAVDELKGLLNLTMPRGDTALFACACAAGSLILFFLLKWVFSKVKKKLGLK